MLTEELVEHAHDVHDRVVLVDRLRARHDEHQRRLRQARERERERTYASRLAEHVAREEEGGHGDVRLVAADELAVEERELHEEARDVLGARLLDRARHAREAQPRLGGRVPDDPADRLEDVTLHLDEGALVVRVAAHVDELWQRRHAVLGVLELGGDPQRGAPDELVVLLEDDALRDVAVDDVEREVERLGAEVLLEVDLDEEVDEVRAHVPPQLGLLVDEVGVGHRLALRERRSKRGRVHAGQLRFGGRTGRA